MARQEQVLLLEPQHELKFRGKSGGPLSRDQSKSGVGFCSAGPRVRRVCTEEGRYGRRRGVEGGSHFSDNATGSVNGKG